MRHAPVKRSAVVAKRLAGISIRQIAAEEHLSQTTVVTWTRHLGRDPGRNSGTAQAEDAEARARAEADAAWPTLSAEPEFMFGLALYIGEGSKTQEVSLTNSDARVLRAALRFFERIGIDRASVRANVQIHDDVDLVAAERFWRRELSLPKAQFYKTNVVPAGRSLRPGKLPFGTARVRARSSSYQLRLVLRWADRSLGR